ncbi:MAG: hypothetical protein OSB46_10250 [Alphaproteobacteria bacterium]|nr:hypothetical protein [Alphaproteobacteria bacterium]
MTTTRSPRRPDKYKPTQNGRAFDFALTGMSDDEEASTLTGLQARNFINP